MNDGPAEPSLRDAVLAAAGRSDVAEEVGRLYDELAAQIAIRKPICTVSGRCCRFEAYGHRMYVTTMELAKFVSDLPAALFSKEVLAAWEGTGCPFQVNGLCGVHPLRPLGCRMFFCDSTATEWQNETYEKLHAELRQLHERLKIPYFYVEWRSALQQLGIAEAVPALRRGLSLDVKSF